jgi:hypothetical protein
MAYDPTATTNNFAVEDGFQTTLSSSINATDLAIPLTTLPTGSEGLLVIEPGTASEEEIYYTSKGTGVVNVPSTSAGRGVNGTATSHASGVTVKMLVSKAMLDSIKKGSFPAFSATVTSGTGIPITGIVDSSTATSPAIYGKNNTNYAHSGPIIKGEFKNTTDTGTVFQAKNNSSQAGVADFTGLDGSDNKKYAWDYRLGGGWMLMPATMTYASSTTFTMSGDWTDFFAKGDKLRLANSSLKYFYITGVSYGAPNTTITVNGGTDYSLANASIAGHYSKAASPVGHPIWFNYTPTLGGFSLGNGSMSAKFCMYGNMVHGTFGFQAGTTSSFSSTLTVTLPIAHRTITTVPGTTIGPAFLYDNSAPLYNTGVTRVNASTETTMRFSPTGVSGDANNTVPWTWATTDRIDSEFHYEIA